MSCYSKIFEKDKEYQNLKEAVNAHEFPVGAVGLPEINKVHIVHSL